MDNASEEVFVKGDEINKVSFNLLAAVYILIIFQKLQSYHYNFFFRLII